MARDGNDDTDEREELDETDERPKKKKKKQKLPREHRHRPRWHWQLLGILMLVFGIAWCLPWVVAWTPLRQQIVGMALPNLDGSAQIGGASLGWFSPIELTDIQLHDRQGQPVLSIASITTERSLWRLALNRKEAGTIRVVRPEVQLVTWPDGSNLETMLRSMFKRPAKDTPRTPSPASFVVEVIDGKAALAELTQAPTVDGKNNATPEPPRAAGSIEKLQAKITHVPSADPPLAMQLDARMVPAGLLPANITAANNTPLVPGSPGTVHAEVTLKREGAAGAATTVRGHVALKAAAAELGPLQPIIARLAGPTRLGGIATTDLLIDWGHDAKGPTITAAGTADARRLLLANAAWLGHSTAHLDSVRLKPDVTYGDGQLTLRLCRAESDFGSIDANGTIDTVRLADATDAATISQAAGQDFELGGSIDIARLAERMPGLIPLRPDTRIESGRLALSLRSRSEGKNRRWEGSLLASELIAVHAGRRLDFRRPIQLSVVAQAQPKGLPTGQLRCTSDYLTCQADGSPTDASASLEADLDRLAADLSQLVDIGGLQLAGHVRAGFEWRSTRPANALAPVGLNLATGQAPPAGQVGSISTLTADGHVMLDNLQIQWPGMRPWQEPRLSAALKLRGAASGRSVARVDEASLRVDSGSDHLVVTLREPVSSPTADSLWPVDLSIDGDVASWIARAQPWMPAGDWQLAGMMRATAQASLAPHRYRLDKSHVQLQTFHGAFAGLVIDEPRIELESSVNYDAATSRLEVPQLTLATSAVSVRADQVVWQTAANARHAGGQIAVRADLGRLSRWLATPGTPPSLQLAGTVVGQADLAETGGMITAKMSAEAQNFVASIPAAMPDRVAGPTTRPTSSTQPWQPVWSEARVALAGAASYRPSTDQLDLDRCEVTSDVLRLARLQARVTELSGQRRIELTGDVDYDLARITPLLWPYVGPGVKLSGRGTRSFALSGPLAMPMNALPSSGVVSAALAGQAGVGFDRAELYGLTTSAGELRGDLKQQVVQFAPMALTVGQGRLMLSPRIDMTSQAVLLHPAQRVAENVELTPEICQAWLKYVAPMLADATRADGKMSIDLSRCSVPLADKSKCDMAGTLLLHTAHVRPGPVAEPLVAMAQQIQMLLQKNPLGTSLGGTTGTSSDVQLNIESQNIQFEVRNGRVSHSPLKIVVGDVEIRTHGSVGFDQTLAILADIPIRQAWIDRNPSLRGLAGQTIQVPVGGTLSRQAIDRRGFDSLARQLGTAAASGAVQGALQKGLDGLLKPRK